RFRFGLLVSVWLLAAVGGCALAESNIHTASQEGTPPLPPYPVSVAIGDFNGDGRLDLAVTNRDADTVSISLFREEIGALGPPTAIAVGSQPSSVAIGDFNEDGILDLAVANFNSNSVSILLGNGDGTFVLSHNIPVGRGPTYIA